MVKIASMGDNVVDCYLARDEMYPGGNCLNVAVHASRFGARSAYIGAVGKDKAGDLINDALTAEGVDLTRMRRLNDATAYCLIGHRNADRVFLDFDLGVSMFAPSQEDLEFLSSFEAVHIGQSSGLDAWVDVASRNALLSYDFSTRREREHRAAIGRYCFLASVSGDGLSEGEIEGIASELLESGTEWVLVTRGRAGAVLYSQSAAYSTPAQLIEPVDTLGAGDAFIARTLFGLLEGEMPAEVLGHAAEAAATTCGYFGAVGYPSPIDLGEATAGILRQARELRPEIVTD
jgi:fructoselysine 6-kinase